MRRLAAAICAALLCAACSEPPQKEIDRAQGAIDAARAAGAEQYATETFAAATAAMQETHDAVQQRDYRLALSRAIDANERALEAATEAADTKAAARSEAEVALTRATSAASRFEEALRTAEKQKLTARELGDARSFRDEAERLLQEARAAVKHDDYARAMEMVKELPERIAAETETLEVLVEERTTRPPRRRR